MPNVSLRVSSTLFPPDRWTHHISSYWEKRHRKLKWQKFGEKFPYSLSAIYQAVLPCIKLFSIVSRAIRGCLTFFFAGLEQKCWNKKVKIVGGGGNVSKWCVNIIKSSFTSQKNIKVFKAFKKLVSLFFFFKKIPLLLVRKVLHGAAQRPREASS